MGWAAQGFSFKENAVEKQRCCFSSFHLIKLSMRKSKRVFAERWGRQSGAAVTHGLNLRCKMGGGLAWGSGGSALCRWSGRCWLGVQLSPPALNHMLLLRLRLEMCGR